MAGILRVLNWLIHRLSEQYSKLEEGEPATLHRANTKAPSDERKPF